MKRILSAAAAVSVALGVVLAGAGTASAQEPYKKYPTKSACETAGFQYYASGKTVRWDCTGPHSSSPASQNYWLYLLPR